MAKIFLIRHAESIANAKGIYQGQTYDTPLSSLGRKQTHALAKRMEKEKVTRVIASPLKRTRETAGLLASHIEFERAIIETNHGLWEGLSKKEIEENFRQAYQYWLKNPYETVFPHGEAFQVTVDRVQKWWKSLIRTIQKNEHIAVVTHDNILRIILCLITKKHINKMWEFELLPAAVTVIECSKIRIVILNNISHLKHLLSNVKRHAL